MGDQEHGPLTLAVRHYPELATPELFARLRPHVRYDADGRYSRWLVEDTPLPRELAAIAEAVAPGRLFRAVGLQCYRDGRATTECHSDRGATGFSFILSLGARRTFRVHRVPDGLSPTAGCTSPELDAIRIECVPGTAILMEQEFHDHWHHQVAPEPDKTGERLSLVFREKPTGR